MTEIQEKMHVVNKFKRHPKKAIFIRSMKVFDDRKDARAYANRYNHSKVFLYKVQTCKKG